MHLDVFMLIFSLAFILMACIFFSNAVEWLGKKLNLSQGVVGSVFAAVGTALPETIIPIIAILFYSNEKADQIGIGAIAGAPFMLGTLAFFISGLAVLVYTRLGRRTLDMNVNIKVFSRDLTFFLIVYGMAIFTALMHGSIIIKTIVAIMLFLSYGLYVKLTLSGEAEHIDELDALHLAMLLKKQPTLYLIIAQTLFALVAIVYGAHLFVNYVEAISISIGISPLILSILITPVATELPEKLNSVIWLGKKDTLALGNLTGAMVFQSCIPVAFGMMFTPWVLDGVTLISAVLAFVSAGVNLAYVKIYKHVNPYALLFGGVLYIIFLIYTFGFSS